MIIVLSTFFILSVNRFTFSFLWSQKHLLFVRHIIYNIQLRTRIINIILHRVWIKNANILTPFDFTCTSSPIATFSIRVISWSNDIIICESMFGIAEQFKTIVVELRRNHFVIVFIFYTCIYTFSKSLHSTTNYLQEWIIIHSSKICRPKTLLFGSTHPPSRLPRSIRIHR